MSLIVNYIFSSFFIKKIHGHKFVVFLHWIESVSRVYCDRLEKILIMFHKNSKLIKLGHLRTADQSNFDITVFGLMVA